MHSQVANRATNNTPQALPKQSHRHDTQKLPPQQCSCTSTIRWTTFSCQRPVRGESECLALQTYNKIAKTPRVTSDSIQSKGPIDILGTRIPHERSPNLRDQSLWHSGLWSSESFLNDFRNRHPATRGLSSVSWTPVSSCKRRSLRLHGVIVGCFLDHSLRVNVCTARSNNH